MVVPWGPLQLEYRLISYVGMAAEDSIMCRRHRVRQVTVRIRMLANWELFIEVTASVGLIIQW